MKAKFIANYLPELLGFLPHYFLLDQEEFNNANIKTVDNQNRSIQDYWKNKNISYDLNEYHFRTSHNFENLKDNEFILATGCSHTFGIGIDESSRWSNQLENRLNIPVVNLAVAGSGVQALINNVCAYIANFNKSKVIVIQIPELSRFTYLSPNGILQNRSYFYVHHLDQMHKKNNSTLKKLDYQGADYHANQEVIIQQLILLQTVMAAFHIPIVYFSIEALDLKFHESFNNYTPYVSNNDFTGIVSELFPEDTIYDFRKRLVNDYDFYKYENTLMEYARDVSHPGDLQNTVWADYLVKILSSKI